jgi:hypothetical protein
MASAACSASYPEPSPLRVMVLIQRGDTGMADPKDETEPLVTLGSTQLLMCNNASRSTLLLQGRASHSAAPLRYTQNGPRQLSRKPVHGMALFRLALIGVRLVLGQSEVIS